MGSTYLSAYPTTGQMTPEERARASTMAYDRTARDYEDEAARARRMRDEGEAMATRTRTAADQSVADYNRGGATPLTGWRPSAITEFAPNQMAQWMRSASSMSARPTAARQATTGTLVTRGGGAGGYRSQNLETFDASALENFDPSEAGATFARGAAGDFRRMLGDELRTLTNRSVGAGRFNTGLFDEDQGQVVTRIGEDFNDTIAQQAGVFSGQRLDALRGGADLRFRRASEMDTNARSVYEQEQELAQRAAERAAADAIAREELDLQGYGLETDRFRVGGDFARSADELAYRRASDLDRMTYDQASELTGVGETRARTGLDAALGRERTYLDDLDRRSDRATSAVSGSRDWAARDRELEELRAELEALRRERTGVGPAGTRYATGGQRSLSGGQMHPNAAVAKAAGVPYFG
jgi:hypothetical protein